jgi:hypothetical protein
MSTWIFNDNKPNKFPDSNDPFKEVFILCIYTQILSYRFFFVRKRSVPDIANCPSYMHMPIMKPSTAGPQFYNENFVLPVIRRSKSVKELDQNINSKQSPYDQSFNTTPNDYLMRNWAAKRNNNNRIHTSLCPRLVFVKHS